MFAVKGWAVDPKSLKAQTEPFKTTTGTADQDAATGQRGDRKRKRGGGTTQVNEDVGKLWERHIEGKVPVPPKKQPKKERKRRKVEEKEPVAEEVQDEAQDGPVDTAPTPKKKDKKDKKNKKNATPDNPPDGLNEHPKKTRPAVKTTNAPAPSAPPPPQLPIASKLTPMQAAMRQKLVSARFRHLNETLYTAPSDKALEMFGQNPDMFEDYHAGFRQQVSVWPENPVDKFISAIRERGKARLPSQKKAFKEKKGREKVDESVNGSAERVPPLPRTQGACIIADLGCGDARLAQTFKDSGDARSLNLKIMSYDLHSPSPLVTKADVANLPTTDGSVDVAIFCLALMGTNWISFIEEAYRILHWKGELWVAEIKSRFGRVSRAGKPVEHSVGGKRKLAAIKKAKEAKQREQEQVNEQETLEAQVDGVETKTEETDVSSFVDVLKRRGFLLKNGDSSIDLSNKMFVKMEFIKAATPTKGRNLPPPVANDSHKPKAKAKFLDDPVEDPATDDEAKVLKPSLYKIR